MNRIIVLSTTDTLELARNIASALVSAREAACVNIIPGMRSIYRWEGKLCDEEEFLLLIKTSAEQFESISSRIRQMHTYKVPEVISLPITAGNTDYLQWLDSSIANQNDN